ncbi:MAG TPA: molybdenum ABC transporter ATP-binding protein [Geobacteraceae bacterium]|nr:molybdenum ABC transporter ATP-binding protein [Geobacteraceae bacterium]
MELRLAVNKSFGAFTLEADFSASGDRLGIFGESGSGKSTLVNLLAGTIAPDDGSIHLDGECLYSREKCINVPPEKRRIAIVFQHPYLFPHMNVRGNLLYGYRRCASENRWVELAPVAKVLQLEGLLDRGVNNLSGGEKQRVAIGRAILSNPRLLLMDEPLSALDDRLKYQIITYLKIVCGEFGIPFAFISHSMVEMRLMADQVIVFEKGKIIHRTTADQLARQRMHTSQVGYINLLKPGPPRPVEGLFAYPWGGGELLVSFRTKQADPLLELSSKDMILFKKHPEAISARNLLQCRVAGLFEAGNRIGVELDCGGERLVAEVARQAAWELGIAKGVEIFAAIKASAFRELG